MSGPAKAPPPPPPQSAILLFDEDLEEVVELEALGMACEAPIEAEPPIALVEASPPLQAQGDEDEPSTTLVLDRSAMPLGPALSPLPSVAATPHVRPMSNPRRPSSIAPVALEIAPARAPGRQQGLREMPTMILRPPAQGRSKAFALGAIAGFCVMTCIGLLFIGGYVVRGRLDGQHASSGPAPVAPVREAPRDDIETTSASTAAPAVPAPSVSTKEAPATPVAAPVSTPAALPAAEPITAPALVKPVTAPIAPSPAKEATASASTPRPAAPAQPVGGPSAAKPAATGTLVLGPGVSGVEVDGVPVASAGSLHLSCGRHKVRVAGKPLRIVDVPCGGSASL